MKTKLVFVFFLFSSFSFAQFSDFAHINFTKANNSAKRHEGESLADLHKLTYSLTQNLETEVEKLRAIFMWITHNVKNDHIMYAKNNRKRKQFKNDSIKLAEWNSVFKKQLFRNLLRKRKTICTGYAYLLKEMCGIVNIKTTMIHGYGRTADVDVYDLDIPNHSWNAVFLNNKWYLLDPTWAAGLSKPLENKFVFDYNNGYFLTNPTIFFKNHFPLNPEWTLLDTSTYTLEKFIESPLVYGSAYKYLKEHILPKKMEIAIAKSEEITFTFQLKENKEINKIEFIVVHGIQEYTLSPKTLRKNSLLTLKQPFEKAGNFDVHLYFDDKIIATYLISVVDERKSEN